MGDDRLVGNKRMGEVGGLLLGQNGIGVGVACNKNRQGLQAL